jgi:hypothetical protein
MAPTIGITLSSMDKIWKAHGLKPHLQGLSGCCATRRLPGRVKRWLAFISPYLDPPDNALVLSVDGKSQIQYGQDRAA